MPTPNAPRDLLQEAIAWCAMRGLVFDLVNENCPAAIKQYGGLDPRKIAAHYYLDDRGGSHPFLGWYLIEFEERLRKLPKGALLAIDFDGTLCRETWPEIGEPNLPLIAALKEAQTQGYRLTLWTCREHPEKTPVAQPPSAVDQEGTE